MRILITTDAVGGVWDYTATLAHALTERGDECLVAVIGEPAEDQLSSLPDGVEWDAEPFALEWLPTATEAAVDRAAHWLRGLAGRWGADIVHLNQFAYATRPLDAPTVVVAHSDVCSWFSEVRGSEPGQEWDRYREWVRAGLFAAGSVVAPTRYQSDLLARHYGRAADRVIHNSLAARAAEPGRRASKRPYVVSAGRAWDEAKGVTVLDEALERLGERAPSAHIAGSLEGPSGQEYVPRRLNAHGRVSRSAMDRLYENAAVYVATSFYEPFGLAPLEAASHGCALLLSDIGSFRELWQDAAVFVPRGSPAALADALEALLGNPARLDALAAAARPRAAARYNVDRMVAEYRGLYARLLGGRKGVLTG